MCGYVSISVREWFTCRASRRVYCNRYCFKNEKNARIQCFTSNGIDSFGLPAEQFAIQTGHHPAEFTKKNIEVFKGQIKSLGFSYDWDREIATSDPEYYKWTQWIFTKLYDAGLAYVDEIPVNWCPELKAVLANEEVIDGKSERGGYPVIRKPMRQWVLKITEYAERLLEDLD